MKALLASLCAVLTVSAPWAAVAGPDEPGPPPLPSESDDVAKARAEYKKGETAYQVGDFDAAIAAYREAYRLSKQAGLLFNIAQAFRLKGDAEQALYFYRSFLRNQPDAKNRAFVEERIKEMEEKLESDRKAREEKRRQEAALAAAAKPKTVVIRENVGSAGRGLRISGAITGAAGILALGGGTIFALRARSAWNDISDLSDERGVWSEAFADKYDGAERDETLSTVFFAVGSAAVIAGGVLYFLGRSKDDDESSRVPTVSFAPTAGGAQVWMTWR